MFPRIAGIIVNMVPYHHARWEAVARCCDEEVHLVELTSRDDFKVLEFSQSSTYRRHTLLGSSEGKDIPISELVRRMALKLDAIQPEVICVSGWGLKVSLAAMRWGMKNRVPIVMLSESNEFDEARSVVKEFIKRRIVSLCSAGLAGGTPQADYLVKLGLSDSRVFVGYDVVDNDFFRAKAQEFKESEVGIRQSAIASSKPYFFACVRFGKKKNIPFLIKAFSAYRHRISESANLNPGHIAHDLVIAGEGEERSVIEDAIGINRMEQCVHLVGAKGYQELPIYYAGAAAFIHASTTEQWGLVVNEAMASGLPVLVSNRCGCAKDLVHEGKNGYTFDPCNEEQLADLMMKITENEERRCKMGESSQEIIAEWGPGCFASGMKAAVKAALAAVRKKVGFIDSFVLNFVLSH